LSYVRPVIADDKKEFLCASRTSLPAAEQNATAGSHSVGSRLSSDSIFGHQGSGDPGHHLRSVVANVDAGGSNPVTSLTLGDIPLSHLPHS